MNFWLSISRGIDAVTRSFGWILMWLTTFMVLIGSMNVIARNISSKDGWQNFLLNRFGESLQPFIDGVLSFVAPLSSNIFFELQTYAFDLVFLLGAAYVFSENGHVRVDVLFSRLGAKGRAWVDNFGITLFLIPFCSLALFVSQKTIANSWSKFEQSPNPGGLARYPMKAVIMMAFTLLIIQGISELIKNIALLRGHPDSKSMHANAVSEKDPVKVIPDTATSEVTG